MAIKILAIIGSPRKGGNTDVLVEKVLEGAKSSGAEIQGKIYLTDLKINPCISCFSCMSKDEVECVQDDDMKDLYKKMLDTDCLILGTPIYWYSCTAQFKAFMDRWVANIDSKSNFALKGKSGLLITAYEEPKAAQPARFLIAQMQHSFHWAGMRFLGTVEASAFQAGEVKNDEEALAKAYEMGLSLNRMVHRTFY